MDGFRYHFRRSAAFVVAILFVWTLAAYITTQNRKNAEDDHREKSTRETTLPVDLNRASPDELVALDGIGPVKAAAIVEYRRTNGNFRNTEEIKLVKGIGEAIFKKIRKDIYVSGKGEHGE